MLVNFHVDFPFSAYSCPLPPLHHPVCYQYIPVYPAVVGTWGANSTDCSHVSALVQMRFRVPTPDAERSNQSSCELLAQL